MGYQNTMLVLINSAMVLVLIAIAFIDMQKKVINSRLLLVLFVGSMAAIYVSDEISIVGSFAAMVIVFSILSFIYKLSRNRLGWGDVKLCSGLAAYLGIEKSFTMLFVSIFLCGLLALILIIANKANRHKALPFAPFVTVGTIATFFM